MLLGAMVSIFSALSFSMNNVIARRGMVRASATQGAFVSVLTGVPLFLIAILVSGQIYRVASLSGRAYLLLSLAGILHFGIGRNFNYRAVGALGSARSQPIQGLQMPYSVFIAFIFLRERVTLLMIVAIALMMLGPTIAFERTLKRTTAPRLRRSASVDATEATAAASTAVAVAEREDLDDALDVEAGVEAGIEAEVPKKAAKPAPKVELRQAEGYTFALMAAACYGTSPILIRQALEGAPELSVLGGAVAYFAAGAYVLVTLGRKGNRTTVRAMDFKSVRVFAAAGALVWLAQMLRFIALSIAPVAIVSPLQRLSSVFTLILASIFNRDLEWINSRVVIGVFVSVSGAILLVIGAP